MLVNQMLDQTSPLFFFRKEETPRSPARRGPGRPRKRKSTGLGPVAPTESQKKVK